MEYTSFGSLNSKYRMNFVIQRFNHARHLGTNYLLLFRLLSGSILLTCYFVESYFRSNPLDPLKTFTTWGVVMCGLYFALSSFLQYDERRTDKIGRYPTLSKITHVIFQVSFTNQLVITGVFWLLIYPHQIVQAFMKQSTFIFIGMSLAHGGILILVWIEFLLNHLLLYWGHFFIVASVGIIYYIMNITLTILYGPVYPVLTYRDFQSYFMIVVSVFLGFIHFYIGIWYGRRYKRSTHELYADNKIVV